MATSVVVAGASAPLMFGALAIWSIGLTGGIPPAAIAVALGLALVGLPISHRPPPLVSVS